MKKQTAKTEKVLGAIYRVGSKAWAKAKQQKAQFNDLAKYENS